MYVLTNLEATATSKVLKNVGVQIDNTLPEDERKTIRDLITKLSVAIDNGLPSDEVTPPVVDNTLPATPPPEVDNETPGAKPKG